MSFLSPIAGLLLAAAVFAALVAVVVLEASTRSDARLQPAVVAGGHRRHAGQRTFSAFALAMAFGVANLGLGVDGPHHCSPSGSRGGASGTTDHFDDRCLRFDASGGHRRRPIPS